MCEPRTLNRMSQFGRVVKAVDLKSTGFTRAGSNPAADDFFSRIWKARERSCRAGRVVCKYGKETTRISWEWIGFHRKCETIKINSFLEMELTLFRNGLIPTDCFRFVNHPKRQFFINRGKRPLSLFRFCGTYTRRWWRISPLHLNLPWSSKTSNFWQRRPDS